MRRRIGYRAALRRIGVLELLASFDPHVAGTPPLGIDLPSSDIDILCHAPDPNAFAETVWRALGEEAGFSMHQWCGEPSPVVVTLQAEGWTLEMFASPEPVAEQAGWRHFEVERRLLALGGETMRAAVMRHRRAGLKTEPAFAAALGLEGDPYAALLALRDWTDSRLLGTMTARGGDCQPSAASSPGRA